ncbi:MAG: copper homeostasis protein CutC [Vicinamibacterales bacterium]
MTRVLVESCVDSLDAALASEAGGAGRLELCARLDVGGTTPDPALVAAVVAAVRIPVMAMVRPRGGDFVYDTNELSAMARDVTRMREAGAHGIVTGVLTGAGDINRALMQVLVRLAGSLPVTCQRAFAAARDLDTALDTLIGLGVTRVLTSGGAPTAMEGADALARLVHRAHGRIAILAGGTVRASNVRALVEATGVAEVHARIIREPGPADASMRARWTADVAALVQAAP